MITKEEGNKPLIGVLLIGIIVILVLTQKYYFKKEIIETGNETTGIVTGYQFSNYAYILKYEYYVENKKFENSKSTSYFKCKDGTEGCVGKEFKVSYLKENPEKSIIDLGIYNKYKNH